MDQGAAESVTVFLEHLLVLVIVEYAGLFSGRDDIRYGGLARRGKTNQDDEFFAMADCAAVVY